MYLRSNCMGAVAVGRWLGLLAEEAVCGTVYADWAGDPQVTFP